MSTRRVSPILVESTHKEQQIWLSSTGFSQRSKRYVLVRLATEAPTKDAESEAVLNTVENMPDGFVLTDSEWSIVYANHAFTELVAAASIDQIRGHKLSDFVGRQGIDLELVKTQLLRQGTAQNVSSRLGTGEDQEGEAVELSGVATGERRSHFGIVIRPVSRRLQAIPQSRDEMPRSVEQLTELVGRMSLKDIVRESTDLIERLCIEAALAHTSDNRASAAEVLGLSRQSLYSKLHRYKLGNLVSESD